MNYLAIPNWRRYQHYRDRTPVWVKLHVESLHDSKLRSCTLEARLLWHEMLKLSATFQNAVPNSPETLETLVGIPRDTCRNAVEELLKKRLLQVKTTRRSASRSDSLEKEVRRDKEKERAREPSAQNPQLRLVDQPCPECHIGGGAHTADCSRTTTAAVG